MVESVHYSDNMPESTITRIVEVFAVWWRFFTWCVLIGGILSAIVAFLIPPKFKSSSSVFPAEKADLFGSIDGVSNLIKSFSPTKGLASLKSSSELDRYIAILQSGRVLAKVIDKFDLVRVYDITSYPVEKTTKELLENVEFSIEDEGYLRITVFDKDPFRAADMANFFVEELNQTNSELQSQNAKANKQFIENRYEKNLTDLSRAEDSLKAFQKRFGVIAMPEQIEAAVKAGAEITAALMLKEVQLGVLLQTQSQESPMVAATQIEITELKKKISDLNSEKGRQQNEMNLLVPFADIPELGSEYIRRYRDVEIQYKILQFITPLYEQAKVEEQRQTPSVIVLDKAFPAERKSKPKRAFIILGGMLISLLSALSYVGINMKWKSEIDKDSGLYHAVSALQKSIREGLFLSSRRNKGKVS